MRLRKKQNQSLPDLDDDIDEVIEGCRSFNISEKLNHKAFSAQHVKRLKAGDVTYAQFQKNGFENPILVEDSNGLGLSVPDSSFSVKDVVKLVGKSRMIDVINCNTQTTESWSLEEFVKYYNTSAEEREKVYNVISLEFTGTALDEQVQAPAVVRELDWAQKVWPLDLLYTDIMEGCSEDEIMFPKVLKYCLMSVAGCFTDFHIDLGGTSVWYHILKGKKSFWLLPPKQENLDMFENWSRSGEQEKTFLADMTKDCQLVTLEAGNTFFIPSGWIHAVYTHDDSLVFGGNFLHSLNIGMQLRVAGLEESLKVNAKYRYPYFNEMQWFLYDHYNIALSGESFMTTADGTSVREQCQTFAFTPVLSKFELNGLRNLREWLANQTNDSIPEELTEKQQLLESMMVNLAKHSKDDTKTPKPLESSMLQWKPSEVERHKASRQAVFVDKKGKSVAGKKYLSLRKRGRRARCNNCKACLRTTDCMTCNHCKDMKKYGGKGRLKQACKLRACTQLQSGRIKRNLSSGSEASDDRDDEGDEMQPSTSSKSKSSRKAKSVEDSDTPAKRARTESDTSSPSSNKKDAKDTKAEKSNPKSGRIDAYFKKISSTPSSQDDTSDIDADSENTIEPLSEAHKNILEEFSCDGNDYSAADLGHTKEHIRLLLSNSNTKRLNLNNGAMVLYCLPDVQTDDGDHEYRVFLKKRSGMKKVPNRKYIPIRRKDKIKIEPKTDSDKESTQSKSPNKKKESKEKVESPSKKSEASLRPESSSKRSPEPSPKHASKPSAAVEDVKGIVEIPETKKTEEKKEEINSKTANQRPTEQKEPVAASTKPVSSGNDKLQIGIAAPPKVETVAQGAVTDAKSLFLSLYIFLDDDLNPVHNGVTVSVKPGHYLHDFSCRPNTKNVIVEQHGVFSFLPLVFGKRADVEEHSKDSSKHCTGREVALISSSTSSPNTQINIKPKSILNAVQASTGKKPVIVSVSSSQPLQRTQVVPASDQQRLVKPLLSDDYPEILDPEKPTAPTVAKMVSAMPTRIINVSQAKPESSRITLSDSRIPTTIHTLTTADLLGKATTVVSKTTQPSKASTIKANNGQPTIIKMSAADISMDSDDDEDDFDEEDEDDFDDEDEMDDEDNEFDYLEGDSDMFGEDDDDDDEDFDDEDDEMGDYSEDYDGSMENTKDTDDFVSEESFQESKTVAAASKKGKNLPVEKIMSIKIETPQQRPALTVTPVSKLTPSNANSSLKSLGKRRRACNECANCLAEDCRTCNFCKDMKKYGGPGKMKQKCIERQCLNPVSDGGSVTLKPSTKLAKGQKSLDQMFQSFASTPGSITVNEAGVIQLSLAHLDGETISIPNTTLKVESDIDGVLQQPVTKKVKIDEDAVKKKEKQPKLPVVSQKEIAAKVKAIRASENCGECIYCLDKPQFGGKNKKKQMCTEKKNKINDYLATVQTESDADDSDSGSNYSDDDNRNKRSSVRKRKLTNKMEEYLAQEWQEKVESLYEGNPAPDFIEGMNEFIGSIKAPVELDEVEETSAPEGMEEEEFHGEVLSDLMGEMAEIMKEELPQDIELTPVKEDVASSSKQVVKNLEALVNVFHWLSLPDLISCSLVCKSWYAASRQRSLWTEIDLAKRTIDSHVALSVGKLQPEHLILTNAITTSSSLEILISQLSFCTVLSLKGVLAVSKLDLSCIPSSVRDLDLSSISDLDDSTMSSMFSKSSRLLSIRNLDLSGSKVGDVTLRNIARNLHYIRKLTMVGCNKITNSGIQYLNTLSATPSIKYLDMQNCDNIQGKNLPQAFLQGSGLSSLKKFDLDGCSNVTNFELRQFVTKMDAEGQNGWKCVRMLLTKD